MKETFTRKIGPLPMWAWTAIIGTVIVGWAWWRNRQTSTQPSSAANASQVPQFVNQTFTGTQPPSAPNPIPDQGPWPRPDQDNDNDTTPPGATSPGGHPVSRVNRAPKVKHQINQIHKEHQDYEQDKRPPARTQVHHGRPARRKRVPPRG